MKKVSKNHHFYYFFSAISPPLEGVGKKIFGMRTHNCNCTSHKKFEPIPYNGWGARSKKVPKWGDFDKHLLITSIQVYKSKNASRKKFLQLRVMGACKVSSIFNGSFPKSLFFAPPFECIFLLRYTITLELGIGALPGLAHRCGLKNRTTQWRLVPTTSGATLLWLFLSCSKDFILSNFHLLQYFNQYFCSSQNLKPFAWISFLNETKLVADSCSVDPSNCCTILRNNGLNMFRQLRKKFRQKNSLSEKK